MHAGKWIDAEGKGIPAACKMLKKSAKEDFEKELETLKKLDHLFIIRFLTIYETDNQK